ncbi:hypothetical protein HFD88_005687 [Aspergillus terreus]|nr:hypothetical protein HFD88_005687 [Aspergillus terreus]
MRPPSQPNSMGSDLELAYASPSGPDGRKRRYRGCSNDEASLTDDGFINEDLRVGGPHLCALPARYIPITKDHPLYSRLQDRDHEVWKRIVEILQSSRVALKSVDFGVRQYRWVPEAPETATAFIIARRKTIDNGWLDTARTIRQYLVCQGLQEVCVELAGERALEAARVFPVLKNDTITTKWPTVQAQILGSIDLTDVFFVGCYRVGHNKEANDNPPTVLVLVNVHGTRDWKDVREAIVGILDQHELSMVAVEISKDRLRCTDKPLRDLDRAACKGPVKPGYGIGVEVDGLAAATFGGYVDLQSPCTGQWLKFGLTCLDGVALEENLDGYSRWRRDGVLDHDLAKPHLCLHSPSLRDLEKSLRELDRELEGWRSCDTYKRGVQMEAEGLLDMMPKADRENYPIVKSIIADTESFAKELRDFRDKNRYQLGHVVGASGKMASTCKSDSLKNMNWALIEVQKRREGPNKLGKGIALRVASSNDLNDLSDGPLFIEGRSSGSSEGAYSGLRPALIAEKMVDGIITLMGTIEHSATGYNGESFSRPGDSGSLIYQRPGKVVGMVFAGIEWRGITLFTRIDDLFEDINQRMGAAGIRFSED